ncbi:MAG: Crp/Fnr family transcriptional regulator [Bacteroidales bacterium]|nr:Crp/Fnr family transcriptional regulator [Bacteroidales bacterium]MCF8402661.1 Crp/Fnr family transcriptional regulator [Bacteroidales bacterium]
MLGRNIAKPPSCVVENQHVSCFDILTEEETDIIDKHKIDIAYKKGEIIAKQGSFASHVIFLKEGLVKVFIEGNPKDLILKIIPSNRLITLSSIFEGNTTFLYSASTYVDSTASLIDADIFKQIIRTNAQFASRIINILNENTAQVYGRFYALTRKQSHGRVADILLCLSQRIYKTNQFVLSLSRNDLADLTGLSPESVIRILKEFKDEKLIEVKGKSIELLNFKSLEHISNYG